MTIQQKPDYSVGVWASNGDVVFPSSEKIEEGHIVEKPLKEVMNWIQNRQDSGILYTFQNGISEWDALTEYPIHALVRRNDKWYRAVSQNQDRDPITNDAIWKVAFDDFGSAKAVMDEVELIKTQEGYLDLYVSKANPVMTGRAKGVSYAANVGIANSVTDQVGYVFNDHETTGMFLTTDGVPVIYSEGQELARFAPITDGTENNKKVVTMDVLRELLQTYKVGDLYLTTSPDNPAIRLGYGTWSRYAEGKALVGFSTSTSPDVPEWTKIGGGEAGEYEVTLNGDNIAPHTHYAIKMGGDVSDLNTTNNVMTNAHRTDSDYNGYIAGGALNTAVADTGRTSNPVGTNGLPITEAEAHNNVQPSITVYVWRRTA